MLVSSDLLEELINVSSTAQNTTIITNQVINLNMSLQWLTRISNQASLEHQAKQRLQRQCDFAGDILAQAISRTHGYLWNGGRYAENQSPENSVGAGVDGTS